MSVFNVIGAGVAGLCVATELQSRGAKVMLWDAAGPPGPHQCSWWAGGMLAPWCEFENAEEPVLRLGQLAANWWSSKTSVTHKGTLVIAAKRDLPDLRRFARRTDAYDLLDRKRLLEQEPDLEGFSEALYFAHEAHLSPRHALSDLFDAFLTNGGEFQSEKAPRSISNAINCTGFSVQNDVKDLRGVKGEMLLIHCPDVTLTRPVRLLHPRIPLYIVPRGDGVYMLGATMIESEDRTRISARSMLELLSAAYAINPAFGEAEILETGVDLRPAFSDNLPKIKEIDGVVYANGLYRHGYLLAPALATAVADFVINKTRSEFCDAH